MGGPWLLRARRGGILIDPLTGMLNDTALRWRVDELAQQSEVAQAPIGVVIGDVDAFAALNEAVGADAADDVLRAVAGVLRATLRAFDLAYRVMGDRFVVLLPGADLDAASNLAEILRAAVASTRHAGQAVTLSLGAAASTSRAGFDYEAVRRAAESALRHAKDGGRDRVWPPPPGGIVLAA